MKAIVAVLLLAAVATASVVDDWVAFKAKYGKTYASHADESARFKIFQSNMLRAAQLNKENTGAVFGMTKFSDLTSQEFHSMYANLNATAWASAVNTLPKAKNFGPAKTIDWRGQAVASVKDQGQCGSCWTFATAAAMEGCAMIINGGSNVDVSAQQIVDCCTSGGSDGCNGGQPAAALTWATGKDLATWDSYPYDAAKGKCKSVGTTAIKKKTCKMVALTSSGSDDDEAKVIAGLAQGPVSIAIAADILQSYNSGIISGKNCADRSVDHAVLLVANTDNALTVKNSWGADWGEKGFFRMAPNVNCLSVAYLTEVAIKA